MGAVSRGLTDKLYWRPALDDRWHCLKKTHYAGEKKAVFTSLCDRVEYPRSGGGELLRVRLDKDGNLQTIFRVHEPAYDLDDKDKDINALKSRVKEQLRATLKMTWENFYLVKIQSHVTDHDLPDSYDDLRDFEDEEDKDVDDAEVKVDLEYELIEVGTKPDGQQCWRPAKGDRYASWTRDGLPDLGLVRGYDGSEQVSMVPATPTNKEALKQLRRAFFKLKQKLYEFLHPDKIEQHLANVPAMLGLTGPVTKSGKK